MIQDLPRTHDERRGILHKVAGTIPCAVRWEDMCGRRTAHGVCLLPFFKPTVHVILLFALLAATAGKNSALLAADVVVVCPEVFDEPLLEWKELRTSQGLTIEVCRPANSAAATHQEIIARSDQSTRYVLLVGDAPDFGTGSRRGEPGNTIIRNGQATRCVPTFYLPARVTSRYGSTPTLPSDLPYGDFDRDGLNDASIGRLPVKNADQLRSLIQRLVQYENSQDFGPWRRRLQLTGGVGGFGALVDGAIESVTRAVLTSVLPSDTKPQIAYACQGHPYCPTDGPFSEVVLERYRSGARFWVYAGHGRIDRLDLLRRSDPTSTTNQSHSVASIPENVQRSGSGQWNVEALLDNDSASKMDGNTQRAPIAVMLACYAGAYDAPGDCLAERMLLADGGPIAVIAASRLTMPYGNARFGLGLLESVYRGEPTAESGQPGGTNNVARLGDAMLEAALRLQDTTANNEAVSKLPPPSPIQAMVDGLAGMISPAGSDLKHERSEHAALYQLIGDPCLRLQPPRPLDLQVERLVSDEVDSKDREPVTRSLNVTITSPISGTLTISVDCPLGASPAAQQGGSDAGTEPLTQLLENADDPHQCTLCETHLSVEAGKSIVHTIEVPQGTVGHVLVRGFVQGKAAWATAATQTLIR